jgi:endoribonuclease Dicer
MSWNAQKWQDAVQVYQVLVGTPETFRQAIEDHGYLPMDIFSLLIIDECHNATGKHPMARLLRARQVLLRHDDLRVLGLTASFVKGTLSCLEMKRKELETLLKATILSVSQPMMEPHPQPHRYMIANSITTSPINLKALNS